MLVVNSWKKTMELRYSQLYQLKPKVVYLYNDSILYIFFFFFTLSRRKECFVIGKVHYVEIRHYFLLFCS